MKKTNHLVKYVTLCAAESAFEMRSAEASRLLERCILGTAVNSLVEAAIVQAKNALESQKQAETKWKCLSPSDRETARKMHSAAVEIGNAIATLGERYSGETSRKVVWGEKAGAYTQTSDGDRYSRSCKYSRTDAVHTVSLDSYRVEHLIEQKRLRELSSEDGLHLIALDPDGAAVWAKKHNKSLKSEAGWIIGDDVCCYHSTISREDAVKGHAKKRSMIDREKKADRRARLVARLCCNAKATIADAKSLGYCDPGIAAFRERYKIGETASLPELCRTGNPSAVRLALHLARKLALRAA